MKKIILLFCLISTTLLFADNSKYPPEWWGPIPREDAKPWEILPQDAKYNVEVILSKRTELGIFSNFAATPFTLEGKTYASVEGFWQMMKYPDPDLKDEDPRNQKDLTWPYTRDEVAQLSGFTAKEAGDATKENYKKLAIDWISYKGKKMAYKGKDKMVHFELITRALKAKIDQNPKAKELLLKTGDLILRADHIQDTNAPPAYHYEEILMKIRSDLQNPKSPAKE